ncbi:MAG: Hypothetical protein AJITA_00553 [Acetilactobacillus jinshanensis]
MHQARSDNSAANNANSAASVASSAASSAASIVIDKNAVQRLPVRTVTPVS